MFVGAPIVYIVIASLMQTPEPNLGPNELLYYMLLGIAVLEPLLYPLIERFQIAGFRRANKAGRNVMPPVKLLVTLMMIKGAMVNAVFIYGLVVYLLTADFDKIYLFYVIGACWSIFYWPRQDKLEAKLQELES